MSPLLKVIAPRWAILPSVFLAAMALAGSPALDVRTQGSAQQPPDRQLELQITRKFSIGSGSGVTLGRIVPWGLGAGPNGEILVLDQDDHGVLVFDSLGQLRQHFGRPGGGPGELIRPVALAVTQLGEVLIADAGKLSLVRFGPDGSPLPERKLWTRPSAIAVNGPGLVVAEGPSPLAIERLTLLRGERRTVLAELPAAEPVRFPSCGIAVPARPLYAASIRWSAASDRVAVADSLSYAVRILDENGGVRFVSRNLPPLYVSYDDAKRSPEISRGLSIRSERGTCRVEPDELVKARGFARLASPIRALVLAPDGSLWVRKQRSLTQPGATDVFDPKGEYLGTLAAETPFPVLFFTARRFVSISVDANGDPVLDVFDLMRSSGNGNPRPALH